MRKIFLAVAVFMLGLVTFSTAKAATTDDIGYHFKILSYQANSFSESRYRGSDNPIRAWMVNFKKSGEIGNNTITRYWLSLNYLGGQASDDHDVKVGSGRHFYRANDKSNKTDVRLGAENNNYNAESYYVSGNWDEETAVVL